MARLRLCRRFDFIGLGRPEFCAPYYKEGGRPGIPPGIYFRMLFIGYFEGLDSQRGIAWRCADSLGLRAFLGFRLTILPESLLWDIIWLVLITVVMGGAFAIVNRSRKTGLF